MAEEIPLWVVSSENVQQDAVLSWRFPDLTPGYWIPSSSMLEDGKIS